MSILLLLLGMVVEALVSHLTLTAIQVLLGAGA
jgi:hypothetical protein